MPGSRNFRQGGGGGGGGGGPDQSDKKKALTTCFFFLVLSLFYRNQVANFKENHHFKGSRGVQHFPGGSHYFQGGPIAYSL